MSEFSSNLPHRLLLASLLIALPVVASADADTALTVGSGPNDYRAYTFKANADIFDLPIQLNLDHFFAKSVGANDMRQSGLGFTWDMTDLLSANYRHSSTNDGTFSVAGNEVGLSFSLDEIWQSDLQTTVDFGFGGFDYTPTDIARAKLANKLSLTQNRSSFGLNQDLTSSFSVYASHDQYKYDRNSNVTALKLFRRTLNFAKAAFTLLEFPDKTNTWGMTWKPLESLNLDLSSGKTSTLLQQKLKYTRLGADFQINDKLNIAASLTRTSTSNLSNGAAVQQASRDTYSEVTAGWTF